MLAQLKRRGFLRMLAAAGLGAGFGGHASAAAEGRGRPTEEADLRDVDPYFLDPGVLPADEQANIAQYVGYQEQLQQGAADAVMPRGGRPKHAPSYRFLHWNAELGDAQGRLVGPLSVPPQLGAATAYEVNAQLLGFHPATADWRSSRRGTLTIELRARLGGEPMTWLYAQQFEAEGGTSTLGLEYIGQRNGATDPIVTDEPSIDLRIQLMRQAKRAELLGKVFKIFSFVTGLATGGLAAPLAGAREAIAPLRIPRMLPEGVAFSQALFGSVSDEVPVWRSGFTSYALAPGAGRLALIPGLWVVIDESQEVDLRGTVLEDRGGHVALTRDGAPVEANHLVLSLEVAETSLPDYVWPAREPRGRSDVVPKDVPHADE